MLRKLTLALVAAILALGTFASATASQATADIQVINGLPFKIDLCRGGNEAVSGLRYGWAVWADGVPAGTYRYVVRKAAPGTCRGKKLGAVTMRWDAGENHSSVIWKPYAKIKAKTFTNDLDVPEGRVKMIFRHMARVPSAIDVWVWEPVRRSTDDWPPTFDALGRGQSSEPVYYDPGQFRIDVRAARPTTKFSYVGYWARTDADNVQYVYLLGNKDRHIRISGFYGPGNPVAPEP